MAGSIFMTEEMMVLFMGYSDTNFSTSLAVKVL